MRGRGLLVLGVGAALLGVGCAQPPPHRSDTLARSRALLDRAERLEADLHTQNAELDVFSELNERRQSATEVTCQVSRAHIKEIERLAEAQMEKRKLARAKRARRVASLDRGAQTLASSHR